MQKSSIKQAVDLNHWWNQISQLKEEYQSASPYPHIVLDNFLRPESAEKALEVFPSVKDKDWIHYVHVNEKKHGLNKMERLPSHLQDLIAELNSPDVVKFLSELTGISGLIADPDLEGGGLHQSQRGGYLNIHADFTVHPHKKHWQRRVNLLLYFNKNWEESYGGDLELWDREMKECRQKIRPIFNRCVIFNTDRDSYHGLPDPIQCPEGETRKSLALYYFTEEEKPEMHTTNYRARPQDGFKRVLIYADKKLVEYYTKIKGRLGLSDNFISNLLYRFNGKK